MKYVILVLAALVFTMIMIVATLKKTAKFEIRPISIPARPIPRTPKPTPKREPISNPSQKEEGRSQKPCLECEATIHRDAKL